MQATRVRSFEPADFDDDVVIVARHMLNLHQALAANLARARASELLAASNIHGSHFWTSVVGVVEKLQYEGLLPRSAEPVSNATRSQDDTAAGRRGERTVG